MLRVPDDVLLDIFYFYVVKDYDPRGLRIAKWIRLAQVCRRWRSVIFQSPHRLNLRLVCTNRTPARDTLDIWPPLPLIIRNIIGYKPSGVDNIIAALERNDRVCQIKLSWFSTSEFDRVTNSAAMQKPFPALTDLLLEQDKDDGKILPDSFFGGTAPSLRSLDFSNIPFPGLPKLLLSATHLVNLDLYIPRSGYAPPEVMATGLSALISLEILRLHFLHPPPRPALESQRLPPPPPPLIRSILPSLTKIQFQGASEYLEVILARIDSPRLDDLHVTFFNQIIFDTPQLFQLISRTPTLRTLGAQEEAHIEFSLDTVTVRFPSQTSHSIVLRVSILCTASEWQLSSLEQVCTSSLPPVCTLNHLYILEDSKLCWQDDVENTLWLELFRPFSAVKNLYVCKKFVPRIAPALQGLVGGRTTEVFPTLENIFSDGFQASGPLHEGIEEFVAARWLTSRPVAVSHWDGRF